MKLNNIILKTTDNLKIIDFGLAIKTKPDTLLKVICGTQVFMAPELHENQFYDGQKTDIWAVGIIFYYMLIGKPPFKGINGLELESSIIEDEVIFPKSKVKTVS